MPLPLVEVLMSTHNGAEYVAEQIESVLQQADVSVRLVIRDDGSSDRTLDRLSDFADDGRVEVRPGTKLGLPYAYFQLIEESGADADLWALADQDDVWLPHKLSCAASALDGAEGPAMYCARVLVVDEALQPLHPHALPTRGPSFPNALVQNIATGSTIVFNTAAREVLRGRWPDYAVMHDAWLYAVISGTGVVVYDPEIVVHYRQHARNAVGMGATRLTRTLRRIQRQLTVDGPGAHGHQNLELRRTHGDVLTPRSLAELDDALAAWSGGWIARARYAIRGPAHRQTRGSNIVLRLLQLAGRV